MFYKKITTKKLTTLFFIFEDILLVLSLSPKLHSFSVKLYSILYLFIITISVKTNPINKLCTIKLKAICEYPRKMDYFS